MRWLLLLVLALSPREEAKNELARVEIELMHADEQLRGASSRVRALEAELAELRQAREGVVERLEDRKLRAAARLRAAYRLRHRGFLPLLFAAESPHDLLRTARYLSWIARADEAALAAWLDEQSRAQGLADAIERTRADLLQTAGEVIVHREELRHARDTARAELGTMPSGQARRVVTLLQEAPAGVPDVQLDLARTPAAAPPTPVESAEESGAAGVFTRSRGHLPMPAVGPVVRGQGGIDIYCPAGTAIRAVADGTVEKVVSIPGFGRVAIVEHGGDWRTVYGRGDGFDVQSGDPISSGQELGRVAEPTEGRARVHFSVRQGTAPKDPVDWLRIPAGVSVR